MTLVGLFIFFPFKCKTHAEVVEEKPLVNENKEYDIESRYPFVEYQDWNDNWKDFRWLKY